MRDVCELCRHDALRAIYTPERSTRGIGVFLCDHCGLLQSLPRIDRAERAMAAVSSGADWGNVRYGKGFRTQVSLDAVARHADLNGDIALLDVGSNRASFARKFLEAAPNATIVARALRRRAEIVTATAALVISTSTPVAYAPPWALTSARKISVTPNAMAV